MLYGALCAATLRKFVADEKLDTDRNVAIRNGTEEVDHEGSSAPVTPSLVSRRRNRDLQLEINETYEALGAAHEYDDIKMEEFAFSSIHDRSSEGSQRKTLNTMALKKNLPKLLRPRPKPGNIINAPGEMGLSQ